MTRSATDCAVATPAAVARRRFLDDVVSGLTSTPKSVPSKHFYDEAGSLLFERICMLDEYYITRTELSIMRRNMPAISAALGEGVLLIEPGSGASAKVRLLLRHLRDVAAYVPVDISGNHLMRWVQRLRAEVPGLRVRPITADFMRPFEVPELPARRRVVYFPGSTIGNFTPDEAVAWLGRMAETAGPGGGLLIGMDVNQDVESLEAAYNDGAGVTREFNLHLLERIRDELGADVDVDRFEHHAFYNEAEGRIEMHLVSAEAQTIELDDIVVSFEAGETIHTENSYKYGFDRFEALATDAGWRRVAHWTDEDDRFSVQYFERRSPS